MKRQNAPTSATCGSNRYSSADIQAAQKKGCQLQKSGQTEGTDKYPHQYDDREGFHFTTASPWYEFPILASHQVYSGGEPSTDRVIFNGNCEFTSVITHTGATDDNFKQCEVTTNGTSVRRHK